MSQRIDRRIHEVGLIASPGGTTVGTLESGFRHPSQHHRETTVKVKNTPGDIVWCFCMFWMFGLIFLIGLWFDVMAWSLNPVLGILFLAPWVFAGIVDGIMIAAVVTIIKRTIVNWKTASLSHISEAGKNAAIAEALPD